MVSAELKSCPFCGGTNLSSGAVSNTGGNVRHIWCTDCHTVGPWSSSGKGIDAIEAWNRRAKLAPETDTDGIPFT